MNKATRGVPDAIHHTDTSESLQYITGWNDCRAAMMAERPAQRKPLTDKQIWNIDACKEYVKQLRDKNRANTAEHAAEAIEFLLVECDALHKEIDGNHALRAALAEQPAEQEPVAWMVYTQNGQSVYVTDNPTDLQEGHQALPLYTTPLQRTWVGLKEQDLKLLSAKWRIVYGAWVGDFARAIEAKLREKNT